LTLSTLDFDIHNYSTHCPVNAGSDILGFLSGADYDEPKEKRRRWAFGGLIPRSFRNIPRYKWEDQTCVSNLEPTISIS